MTPPVPGRFTTSPESSSQVDQHIQKSDSSDNVCPSKSSPENSKISPIFSPPENNAPPVSCDIPLASSPQDRLNDTHAPPSFVLSRPESAKNYPQSLFTTSPSMFSSIPVDSGHRRQQEIPIWNRLDETIKSPPLITDSVFASDRNFRSTISATETLGANVSPINWPSISTPIFNSSSQKLRPAMGNISTPSISGFRPPIVNPLFQFGSSVFCSSPAKLDAFPAGSSNSTTGSSSSAPSPAHGGAPAVSDSSPARSLSHSSTRPSQLSSVMPPVNSAVHVTNQGTPSVLSLPISFKDVLAPSSPRTRKKSFEEVLNSMEELPEPTLLNGVPGIRFPDQVIASLIEPFKFALVGKISGNRSAVPNNLIAGAFSKLGMVRSYDLKFLPRGFLVVTLSCEDDYARLWTRGTLFVGVVGIRFSKWTPEFKFQAESPIAPVWVRLPELPLHLFDKKSLCAIAKILGNPIKVDDYTADASRGAFARLCVEINVLDPPVKKIWVGWGDHSQEIDVIYEKIPSYCADCRMLGHATEVCYSHGKNPRPARSPPRNRVPPQQADQPNLAPQVGEIPNSGLGPEPQLQEIGRGPNRRRRRPARRVPPRKDPSTVNAFECLQSMTEEQEHDDAVVQAAIPTPLRDVESNPDVSGFCDKGRDPPVIYSTVTGSSSALGSSPSLAPFVSTCDIPVRSWAKEMDQEDAVPFVDRAEDLGSPHHVAALGGVAGLVSCFENHSSHSVPSVPQSPLEVSSSRMEDLIVHQGSPVSELHMVFRDSEVDRSEVPFRGTRSCDGRDSDPFVEDALMTDFSMKRKKGADVRRPETRQESRKKTSSSAARSP